MDVKKLLDSIQKGVEFAEGLMPTVVGLGIPGAGLVTLAIKAVGAVTEIVENVQTRAAEAGVVLKSDDQAELRGYAQRLSAVNDELAAYIDQS